jgi:MSHA biogenesis protein MshE
MKSEKVTAHPSSEARRSKLGEILVEQGAITVSQLEHALSEQATLKLPLGQILLKLDYVTDETMRQALGLQLNVPYLDLENVMIDRGLARVINPTYAKRHSLLPVATVGRTLTVAMDDPTATAIVQDLTRLTGFSITVVTSSSRAILRAFKRLYDDVPDLSESTPRVEQPERPARSQMIGGMPETEAIVGSQGDLLLRELMRHTLEAGATDLHLDFTPSGVVVRERVGGVLKRASLGALQTRLNEHASELAPRLRALGKADDAAGSARVIRTEFAMDRLGHGPVLSLRVSLLPARHGLSVAMRVIDRTARPRGLDVIGVPANVATQLSERLQRRAGLVLVTGPATLRTSELLHACLLDVARGDRYAVTVEDPITFVSDAVTQTEAGPASGTTLASQLKALLQHDPDVVMVSDIADRETAAIAVRAAQSGRLVLAGFAVGNVATDVVPCLLDLGIPTSAIAQMLVAVLHQTGPSTVELWTPDDEDARLILQNATSGDLQESARRTTISS